MKIFKKTIIYTASALMLGLTSCSDFLTEYSQDLAKVEGWQDLDEVLLGSGYLQPKGMSASGRAGDDIDCLHFMGDELIQSQLNKEDTHGYIQSMYSYYTWQQEIGYNELYKYVGGDDAYWNKIYSNINVCNMVAYLIDEQPEYSDDDVANKRRIKGEAFFLRGAYYFLLANMYAQPYDPATAASTPGVPVKNSEIIEDKEYSRGSLAQTYESILDDLSHAEELLLNAPVKTLHRATYPAVLLLKSRVYLYMQDWKNAALYASKVLDCNSRLLELRGKRPGDDCVYLSSPETLFSMGGYAIAAEFSDGYNFWGPYSPAYLVSDDMVNLYAHDDLRGTLYIGKSEELGIGPVFIKRNGQYSKRSTTSDVSSTFLLRTPEAYLTLAEASAFDGNETLARSTMESFMRTRYSSPVTVDQTGNDLIDLIREERAREFILEGHRWFDLRRYTVCQPYPWSKIIEHGHCYYDYSDIDHIEVFQLEKNDAAYTLPIPRPVREFQASLGNNPRPVRKLIRTEEPDMDDDDDDDWDW